MILLFFMHYIQFLHTLFVQNARSLHYVCIYFALNVCFPKYTTPEKHTFFMSFIF